MKLRMLWVCSHTMLRSVELPLLIEAGYEVIPIEVVPGVMTSPEGLRYDEAGTALDQLWRAQCTLPPDILTMLQRSRLLERDGVVTPEEAALFNASIDVIYIATRLELIPRIATWFHGKCLFRHFGYIPDGNHYIHHIPKADKAILRDMIYLPIFRSLLEGPVAPLVDHRFVLHSHMEMKQLNHHWQGASLGKPALVVLSSVGIAPDATETIRALLPLAKKIPLRLLGKNVLSSIPPDIRAHFEILPSLSREAYLQAFFECQFLLYPHARRDHGHYVPVEAIAGGMPLLFRTDTPTFIENDHPRAIAENPERIGAAQSHDALLALAERLYNQPERLAELAARQPYLLTANHVDTARNELVALTEHLQRACKPRIDPAPPASIDTALMDMPCAAFFRAHLIPGESDTAYPLAYFFDTKPVLESVQHVSVAGERMLAIPAPEAPLQLVLGMIRGAEPLPFSPSTGHALGIRFTGHGQLHIAAEIYVNDEIVGVYQYPNLASTTDSIGQQTIFFAHEQPCLVVLYFSSEDGVLLLDLAHHTLPIEEARSQISGMDRIRTSIKTGIVYRALRNGWRIFKRVRDRVIRS